MPVISLYTGDVPALNQTQPVFDTNTQDFIDYIANLAPEINAFAGALTTISTTTSSVTSNSIPSVAAQRTFTVEAGKSFFVGMSLRAAFDATNYVNGEVDSYSGTTLVLNVNSWKGSGTYAVWAIFQSTESIISTPQIEDDAITQAKLSPDVESLLASEIKSFTAVANTPSNAVTITLPAGSLQFRSTTLPTGTPVTRTIGSPITLVISSGSTLGALNATASRIGVLAIDNGGTVELAAVNVASGVNLDETGLISTTAEGGAGGADSATVIYSTTARTNVAYRVIGYYDETQTTAGTHSAALTKVQGLGGQATVTGFSSIRLNTPLGNGSTNTSVRRWTNTVLNQGLDITYTDSATLGATFTINANGIYAISYSDAFSAAADMYLTLNSTTLNAVPATVSQVLSESTTAAAAQRGTCGATLQLNAGDVIRCQSINTGVSRGNFTITRVA